MLVTGVEDPDTRAHGANEGLHLAEFEKVLLAEALLLRNLGPHAGLRIQAVIVHCLDPRRLAAFWAEALGWTVTVDEDQESVVEPQPGSREDSVVADLLFIRVAEPEQGQTDSTSTSVPRTRPRRSIDCWRSGRRAPTSTRATTCPGR